MPTGSTMRRIGAEKGMDTALHTAVSDSLKKLKYLKKNSIPKLMTRLTASSTFRYAGDRSMPSEQR